MDGQKKIYKNGGQCTGDDGCTIVKIVNESREKKNLKIKVVYKKSHF